MDTIAEYNAPPRSNESAIANEGGYVHEHPRGQLAVEMNSIAPESRLVTHGKSCIYVKDLAFFSKNRKSSKIWEHGVEVMEVGTQKRFWLCKYCYERQRKIKHLYSSDTSSQKMADHVWDCSRVDLTGKRTPNLNNLTVTEQLQNAPRYRTLIGLELVEKMRYFFIRWIVTMHIAFSVCGNQFFRDFIGLFSKTLVEHLPMSGHTIRKWVMEAFQEHRKVVKIMLHKSRSNIHLSFDLWTSKNHMALIAVVNHFIDENGNPRTVLLAIRRIRGTHSGENMAQQVIAIIQDYDIVKRLGYFVLDNADTNDTCVETVLKTLRPDLNKRHRRLRCLGHIINLAAQALLYGHDPEAFTAEVLVAEELKHEQKLLDLWRKRGPIGKLHNIVKFIRWSPQRRDKFNAIECDVIEAIAEVTKDLMVQSDNATRWNSACTMIERAIRLRYKIDRFCAEHQKPTKTPQNGSDDGSVKEDTLSHEDWDTLKQILEFIKPFKEATKRLEGNAKSGTHGKLWECLPAMELLIRQMKERQRNHATLAQSEIWATDEHKHLLHCLNNSVAKLEKYHGLINESPAYVAAVVMHPTKRWKWIELNAPTLLGPAKIMVQMIWDTQYKDTPSSPRMTSNPTLNSSSRDNTVFDDFLDVSDEDIAFSEDSYTVYCEPGKRTSSKECPDDGIIEWWREHSHEAVAKFGWDMLAIPAMSAECERVFSSAGRLLTPIRSSLQDDVIEASECLRAWILQGIEAS